MGTLWDAECRHWVWGHSEPGLRWHNPSVSPVPWGQAGAAGDSSLVGLKQALGLT